MKILFVYHNDVEDDNPFVNSIKDGLLELGHQIDCGLDIFWNREKAITYDIIHFQWPEAIFNWSKDISNQQIIKLKTHINYLKSNSKIFYTKHNQQPHEKSYIKIYEPIFCLIEQSCDYIIHLGRFSKGHSIHTNSDKDKHIIIYHHTYNRIYKNDIVSQKEAKRLLGLPKNKKVILAFGAFRNELERKILLDAFEHNKRNTILLAPRWHFKENINQLPLLKRLKKGTINFLSKQKELLNHLYLGYKFIDSKSLPLYFIASDVVFIQRIDSLNSGNLPMAFLFKKTVIVPAIGNMKELVEPTLNPIYNPNIAESVSQAIRNGLQLSTTNLGQDNYNHAKKCWSTEIICKQYENAYNNALKQ